MDGWGVVFRWWWWGWWCRWMKDESSLTERKSGVSGLGKTCSVVFFELVMCMFYVIYVVEYHLVEENPIVRSNLLQVDHVSWFRRLVLHVRGRPRWGVSFWGGCPLFRGRRGEVESGVVGRGDVYSTYFLFLFLFLLRSGEYFFGNWKVWWFSLHKYKMTVKNEWLTVFTLGYPG